MKKQRIAINGFGRIGRMVARSLIETPRPDIELVAINDLSDTDALAHMLRYDSVHGRFPGVVTSSSNSIDFGLGAVRTLQCKDPQNLPWLDEKIDIVLECTGRIKEGKEAQVHLDAGSKKVLIAAPCKDVDHTVVFGVNHTTLKPEHKIVSNASCTTNALAPVADVLHRQFGIVHGFMTTIHAYTNDQRLVDSLHSDLRRARAAGMSMIPSTTGAAQAVGLVLPALKGRLSGTAIRVPTSNVSVIDVKIVLEKDVTKDDVNQAFVEASQSEALSGILGVTHEPLVSIDFNHTKVSSTVDSSETHVVDGRLVRVLAWYDNEWGFTHRLCDVVQYWI